MLLLQLAGLQAQEVVNMLHLDKPYYVTGETVYFKAYFSPSLELRETILLVEIYDPKGGFSLQSYIKKGDEDWSTGYYKIPYNAISGLYTLKVRAQTESSEQGVTLAHVTIPIFNDLEPVEYSRTSAESHHAQPMDQLSDLNVSLELTKPTPKARDSVSLRVQVKDAGGNPIAAHLSISVVDVGLIGESQEHPYQAVQLSVPHLVEPLELSQYIPVKGQLVDPKPDQLLTFFMPEENKIVYTNTDQAGKFNLRLPEFGGSRSLHFVGAFSGSNQIELKQPPSGSPAEDPVLTPAIDAYINFSKQRKLIYQLFNQTETNLTSQGSSSSKTMVADRVFKASEYPFDDLPQFCKEVSTPLKFAKIKGKGGGFEFKMYNPESRKFYFGNPLFIVDGHMTKDYDYLSTLDFQRIDSIKLYYDNVRLSNDFGFAGFSGVVIVSSMDGSLAPVTDPFTQIFTVEGLQPGISWEQAMVKTEAPSFRPQLFWSPTIQTNHQGSADIYYRQSDDRSHFQITVIAQSSDGRRGQAIRQYQVIP
jgi:hypothetical protein